MMRENKGQFYMFWTVSNLWWHKQFPLKSANHRDPLCWEASWVSPCSQEGEDKKQYMLSIITHNHVLFLSYQSFHSGRVTKQYNTYQYSVNSSMRKIFRKLEYSRNSRDKLVWNLRNFLKIYNLLENNSKSQFCIWFILTEVVSYPDPKYIQEWSKKCVWQRHSDMISPLTSAVHQL